MTKGRDVSIDEVVDDALNLSVHLGAGNLKSWIHSAIVGIAIQWIQSVVQDKQVILEVSDDGKNYQLCVGDDVYEITEPEPGLFDIVVIEKHIKEAIDERMLKPNNDNKTIH